MHALAAIALTAATLLAGESGPDNDEVVARVDRVIAQWQRTEDRTEVELTRQLVEIGVKAECYLGELLEKRNARTPVASIAATLGRIGTSPETVDSLAILLSSTEQLERLSGVEAMGELKRTEGAAHLIGRLDDSAEDVCAASVTAILSVAQANPKFDLVELLKACERDLKNKEDVALLLGKIGTPDAREVLREFVSRRFEEKTILAGLAGLWLCGESTDAGDVLDVLLTGDTIAVRRKACLVLGKLNSREALRDLIDCLYDEHRGLVHDAHWALRQITGLYLNTEPKLWEAWWERSGSKLR